MVHVQFQRPPAAVKSQSRATGSGMCGDAGRQLDASDDVAAAKFLELIDESLHTKATLFNDACHLLKHA